METTVTSSSSKSLQTVSNPSLHLTLYNRNENKENELILQDLESKINVKFNNELSKTEREAELTDYIKSMKNINKEEFKTIFFENAKREENLKEYSIFNIETKDFLKIAEYMGIDKSLFGLGIQTAAGIDVFDIIYDNFQQRMDDVKLYIEKTKLDVEYDINKLIRHSRSLIKNTIAMVRFLIIYMVIVVNFVISSTLMGKKIWNYMRPTSKKEESLIVIEDSNRTNSILDILDNTLEIVEKVDLITTRKTRKKQ